MSGIIIGGNEVFNLKDTPGILANVIASRPAASIQNFGVLFLQTDSNPVNVFRSNGTTWIPVAGGGGGIVGAGNGLHIDTGDVFLGGTLTEDTTIDAGNNDLQFIGTNANGSTYQFDLSNGDFIRLTYTDGVTGLVCTMQFDATGSSTSISDPVTGNDSQVFLAPDRAELSYFVAAPGTTNEILILETGYFLGSQGAAGSHLIGWTLDIGGPGLVYSDNLLQAGFAYGDSYLTNGVSLYGQNYIPSLGDLSALGLFNPPSTLTSKNNTALLDTPVYVNPVALNRLVAVSISILVNTFSITSLDVSLNYQDGNNLNTTNSIATIINSDTISIPVQTIYVFASGNINVIVTPSGIGSVDYDVYASVQYLNVQN